jgi:hypothetical protein
MLSDELGALHDTISRETIEHGITFLKRRSASDIRRRAQRRSDRSVLDGGHAPYQSDAS